MLWLALAYVLQEVGYAFLLTEAPFLLLSLVTEGDRVFRVPRAFKEECSFVLGNVSFIEHRSTDWVAPRKLVTVLTYSAIFTMSGSHIGDYEQYYQVKCRVVRRKSTDV
jgi:hypothetical protein